MCFKFLQRNELLKRKLKEKKKEKKKTSAFFKVHTWHTPAESAATRQEAFKAIEIDLIPISEDGVFLKNKY